MTSRNAATRMGLILQELRRAGGVRVQELTRLLGVSLMTVRRDLADLERQGLLRRTHGGAVAVEPMLYEPFRYDSTFQVQEQLRAVEKRQIALAAAALVPEGAIVALTPGTTTTAVARSLRHRRNLTIVTNTVNVAMELSDREELSVFVTGGFLRGNWFSLVGAAGAHALSELFVDIAFIGVNGIDAARGLTASNADEAAINRVMVQQARRRICVADHTKLGVVSAALICQASEIDLLITDEGASAESIEPFQSIGVEVHRV